MSKKLKLALIYGGTSKEREVSLITAKSALENLNPKKYQIEKVEVTKDSKWLKKNINKLLNCDVALVLVHGQGGEDGSIQGLLQLLNKPFTSSGILSSSLALNKVMAKRLVAAEGIVVPAQVVLKKKDYAKNPKKYLAKLGKNIIIKSGNIGSALGTTLIKEKSQIKPAIEKALEFGDEVLIEEYIEGREFTVPVLGNDNPSALPVIEIVPKNGSEFFDFNAKYFDEYRDEIVNPKIPKTLTQTLQKTAVFIHKLFGCKGLTRSDFILGKDNKIYFLEINTIPGLTSASLSPQSAAAVGITYPKLLDKLIQLALEKE